MFWLRNKKNNFQSYTIIWRSDHPLYFSSLKSEKDLFRDQRATRRGNSYHLWKYFFGIGLCSEVRFKPACPATETSAKNEISPVASLDMIFSNKRITKALIRLRRCVGWSVPLLFATPPPTPPTPPPTCFEAHIFYGLCPLYVFHFPVKLKVYFHF